MQRDMPADRESGALHRKMNTVSNHLGHVVHKGVDDVHPLQVGAGTVLVLDGKLHSHEY